MSIFSKLFKLFLTVVLMPLIPMVLLLAYYQAHMKTNVLETHYNLARIVASAMTQHIEDLNWRLSFSHHISKLLAERKDPQAVLVDAISANPDFVFLAVLDKDGKEISRSSQTNMLKDMPKMDLSEDPFLKQIKTENRLSVSSFGVALDRPVSEFLYPLSNEGYLYGVVSFFGLFARIQEQRIGRTGQIYWVDEDGQFYDSGLQYIPSVTPAQMNEFFLQDQHLIKKLKGADATYVGAFAPAPILGTYVTVLQLRDEAYRSIHYSNVIIIIFMIAIATLAYFGALTFAESLGEPIAALSEAAKEVSQGHLDQKIDANLGWGEFKGLIAAFNKMTDDLKDYQALQLKNQVSEMKEHVFRAVAHDLRAPLLGLQGYIYILSEGKVSSEEEKNYLKLMDEAAQNLSALLEDVLEVSRLESGLIPAQKTRVDLKLLVDHVINTLLPVARAKHIELSAQLKAGEVFADAKLLQRLLMNLVSNAIKFTERGRVIISSKETDKKTQISVKDTGIGLSGKEQQAVFDKYHQTDNNAAGYGLGLFISRQIAQAHNGELSVQSEPGKGSTFTLTLPKEAK